MNDGYNQAVENLAFAIDQAAIETMDPIVEEHGIISAQDAKQYMTDSDMEQWEEIERISGVICATYDVEYDALMNDTAGVLMTNLMALDNGVQ